MVIEFVVVYKNKIYLNRFIFGANLVKTLKVEKRQFFQEFVNPQNLYDVFQLNVFKKEFLFLKTTKYVVNNKKMNQEKFYIKW